MQGCITAKHTTTCKRIALEGDTHWENREVMQQVAFKLKGLKVMESAFESVSAVSIKSL